MNLRLANLALTALLAFGAAAATHAQERAQGDQTVLPVWNNSGQIEALLVLEPTREGAQAGTRWRFGSSSLDTTFGLEAGDSLALLCNHQGGLAAQLGNLANNCMLASLDGDTAVGARRSTATAAFNHSGNQVGVTVGDTHGSLPAWLSPGSASAAQVDGNDLTIF